MTRKNPINVDTFLSTLGEGSLLSSYLCVGGAELGRLKQRVEAVVPVLAELVSQFPVAPGSRRTAVYHSMAWPRQQETETPDLSKAPRKKKLADLGQIMIYLSTSRSSNYCSSSPAAVSGGCVKDLPCRADPTRGNKG